MNQKESCERMISEWLEKLKQASESADYVKFQEAERELGNYRQMLAFYS